MKKFHSLCASVLLALTACNTQAPYITHDCEITFKTSDVMGTQLRIFAEPKDDRAYYYYSIISQAAFDSLHIEDYHFMTLMLDSLYRDYLEWRSPLLWENEEYITDFRSFSFNYGPSDRYCVGLTPNTDYMIYGFCINPDNIQQPIGKLYRQSIRTGAVDLAVSPTVFDFSVVMEQKVYEGTYGSMQVTARPSLDGHLSREPYLFFVFPESEFQDEPYNGNLILFTMVVSSYLQYVVQNSITSSKYLLYSDISSISNAFFPEDGEKYVALAAAYRISWPKALYMLHFEYEKDAKINFTHEPLVDHTQECLELQPKCDSIFKAMLENMAQAHG